MDELIMNLISALINGVALLVGVYLGEKLTVKAIRRVVLGMMEESVLLKNISELVTSFNSILSDEKAVDEVTKFFKEARELVTSPEAKNFFKNAAEMMKEFSSEDKVKLKMPEKKDTKIE